VKELIFVLAFIWFLTSVGSLFLGPFIGLDRAKLKRELVDYWRATSSSTSTKLIRRLALIFSWAGFLFPVIFPMLGIATAMFFALFT
jgi:hypothetical protein